MEHETEEVAGAELAAMGPEMAALDAEVFEQGPAPEGAEATSAVDPAKEMAAVIGVAVGLLSPALPYLPGIYTQERIQQIAAAYVPVAEKHGWNMGGWMEQWGAEIALGAVALPALMQTVQAHKAYKDAKARAAAMEKGQAPAAAEDRPEASPPGVVVGTVTG